MFKVIFSIFAIWNILMFCVNPYSFFNFFFFGLSIYWLWETYKETIMDLWFEDFGDK